MLDLFTTLIILAAICGALSIALVTLWLADRALKIFLWWSSAFLLSALGLVLIAARGQIPDLLSIEVANALILLGLGLLSAGVRVFDGSRAGLWFLTPPLLWILVVPVPAVNESIALRTVLGSLGIALATFLVALELWRHRAEQPGFRPILAALCLLQTFFSLLRGALALNLGLPDDIFQTQSWMVFSLLQPAVILIVLVLFGVMTVMERQGRQMRARAASDSLTGVLNRGGFTEQARRALIEARDHDRVSLVLFDLDSFKRINDSHGHAAGDRVLIAFCRLAGGLLRPADLFGRLGGEEFALLLLGTTPEEAFELAERIRIAFDRHGVLHEGRPITTTVSAGVASEAVAAADLERLLAAADRALYEAKAAGRNRVQSDRALARGA